KQTDSFSGSPFSGFGTRLAGGNNLLFANYGRVADGSDFSIIGDISLPLTGSGTASLEVDLTTSRVIFARGNEVAIFDTQAFTPIAYFEIPDIGSILEVVRYGASGLAFRTDNSEIVFLDDATLIPSGDPVDLSVGISSDVEEATLDTPHRYTFQVTNTSDTTAKDVTMRLLLNDGQHFSSGVSNLVPGSVHEVAHNLGDLDPGETALFEASAIPERLTVLIATVVVTTSSLDEDYNNNTAVDVLNVGFESTPNSLNVVEIPTADVKVHPIDGDLVIATTSASPAGIADSVLIMNPLNGRIAHTIKLPGEVVKLTISEDGSTVYALGKARNLAYKVSLIQYSVLDTLSFPSLSIDDLEVLNGATDSIVLGSGWDGVRVYDNGVLRPKTSGTYNGDQVELLPDPSLVFGYNTEHTGFESFKFLIDSEGVQTQVENGGLFSGFSNDIESDGYNVYSPDGTAVRADIMAVAGSFDLNTAFGTTFYSGSTGLEPDRDLQRVYFSRGNRIVSFDSESYLKVREITFGSLSASQSIARLVRWGGDGFAAILGNNHLAIIRSDIVPAEPSSIDFVVSPEDGAQVSQTPVEVVGRAFSGQGIQSISVNGQEVVSANGYADWVTQVDLTPGPNLLTFEVTPFGGGSSVTRHVTITYDLSVTAVLEEKARTFLGTSDLPNGWESSDDDGDGYSLRDEILLGMDHMASDQPLLLDTLETTTPGVGTFAYRRLKSLRDNCSLKASSDLLTSWSDAHPAIIYIGSPVTVADDPDYEDVYFQAHTDEYPVLFFQLVMAWN
ncbi:MAG: DUF11 domain-containing protein, partial [Gammaproteobacteria bacterium]|nr:DUF11 domain-containing protein [Gammaproteobacteria bacterium]